VSTYLVWSNQQRRWWGPAKRGYTSVIEEAGRYTRAEAEAIVTDATLGGTLTRTNIDPYSGTVREILDEVMVLAPEAAAEVEQLNADHAEVCARYDERLAYVSERRIALVDEPLKLGAELGVLKSLARDLLDALDNPQRGHAIAERNALHNALSGKAGT